MENGAQMPATTGSRQWELKPAPTDGVTDLCFSPATEDILAVSSWDSVCASTHKAQPKSSTARAAGANSL